MTENGQLELLDLLNIASFTIGLINLQENLTQGDKQDLQQELTNKAEQILQEIHRHLKDQDLRLDRIERILEDIADDHRRDLRSDIGALCKRHDDPRPDGGLL